MTLIRMMKSISTLSFKVHKKNNLKTLGSMGEPALDVAKWFNKSFGQSSNYKHILSNRNRRYYMFTDIKIILKKSMELW